MGESRYIYIYIYIKEIRCLIKNIINVCVFYSLTLKHETLDFPENEEEKTSCTQEQCTGHIGLRFFDSMNDRGLDNNIIYKQLIKTSERRLMQLKHF